MAEPSSCGLEPWQAFWETHSSLLGGRQGPSVPQKAVPSPPGRQFRPFVLGLPLPFEGQRNPSAGSPIRPLGPLVTRVFLREATSPGLWPAAGVLPAAQMTPRRAGEPAPQPPSHSQPPSHFQPQPQFPLEEPADFPYLRRTQHVASGRTESNQKEWENSRGFS